MKSTELKLIAELMKNSHPRDRELAHALEISQPTASRTRAPFVDHAATLSFLVDLTDPVQYRYLTFSTLAEFLSTTPK